MNEEEAETKLTEQDWRKYTAAENIKKTAIALTELALCLGLPINVTAQYDIEDKNFKSTVETFSTIDKVLQKN